MPSTTFSRSPPNSSAWHWQFSMTWLLPHLTICQSHTQPNPWKNSLLPTTGLLHLLLLCLGGLVPTLCHLANTPSSPKAHFKYVLRAKGCSNYCTIALISHASCSKSSKPGFNSTWTKNFQMFKLDLEKAEKPEIKLPTSVGSQKKQESSRKTSTSALFTTPKPLTMWIITNCGKFFKRWEYQTTLPASWEICRPRSNS